MYKMPTAKLYDSLEVLFNVMVREGIVKLDLDKSLEQQREDTCNLLTKVIEGTFGEDMTPEDLLKDRSSLDKVAQAMVQTLELVKNPELRQENPELMNNMIKDVMTNARDLRKLYILDEDLLPKTDAEIQTDAEELGTKMNEELNNNAAPQQSEIEQQRELDQIMTYGLTRGGQIATTQGPQLSNMKGAIDQGPAYSSRGGSIHRGEGLDDEGASYSAELDEAAENNFISLGDLGQEVQDSLVQKGFLHPRHGFEPKPGG